MEIISVNCNYNYFEASFWNEKILKIIQYIFIYKHHKKVYYYHMRVVLSVVIPKN